MKVFKSRLGLSSQWLAFLTILPALVIVWSPVTINPSILILLAIASSVAVYFILALLPRQSILVCSDDFVISNRFSTKIFEEITDIRFVDCGSVSGWTMSLFSSNVKARPMFVPYSQIQSSGKLLEHIETNAELAKVSYRTKLFGSVPEWIIALESTLFLIGAVRLILAAVA